MMGRKLAESTSFTAVQRRRAVRNPDALPLQIHLTGRGMASGLLRPSTGEKRPVEDGQFRVPGWIRNGDGKEAGVFIVHIGEFDALPTGRSSRARGASSGKDPPIRPARSVGLGRKCRVGHHVAPERFHERDPRILAPALAAGLQLIVGFRFQCDAKPLDSCRIAGVIEPHSCDADARIVSLRDQPRKEVELAIGAAGRGWIQDALRPPGDCPAPAPSCMPRRCNLKSAHQSFLTA